MKRASWLFLLLAVASTPIEAAKRRIVGSDGLSKVWHDSTLVGDGTATSLLSVTPFFYVSTLNGKSGRVNITAGQGITLVPTGDGFAIASSVAAGTAVSSVNGLTGAINLAGTNGLSVSASGNTITFTAPNGGGGLTLPFNQTVSLSGAAFTVANSSGLALLGRTQDATNSASSAIIGSNDVLGGVGYLGAGIAGVTGTSTASSGSGLFGSNSSRGAAATGVTGFCPGCVGVYGTNNGSALGFAALFGGNVGVVGTLSKSAGSFKIDHPLDPENKYLYHSFVESPDMKNIYDGVIMVDSKGEAQVT
jgi:hypothetical protein